MYFSKNIIQELSKSHTVSIQPDRGPNCLQLFILNRRHENVMKIDSCYIGINMHFEGVLRSDDKTG